jgi:hypothetical protein
MSAKILSPPSGNLAKTLPGIWWLLSREDWTLDGQQRIDPVLGADPIAILCYANNHFAAQFMKRDRSSTPADQVFSPGQNNTNAIGGYDAYFGTYIINEATGNVTHTLIGAINPVNIGMTTSRSLRVEEDQLTLQLDTTTAQGEPIIRTLIWSRLS